MIKSNSFFDTMCRDCAHRVQLKYNFRVGIGYEHSNACTAFVDDTPPQKRDANCFVVEVKVNDMCELFEAKGKDNGSSEQENG